MIYLDHNATTPLDKRVLDAMLPYFIDNYGNPASDHAMGVSAKQAIETARSNIADIIGARPNEIIFTSGATESNNLAILGVVNAISDKKSHVITSCIEHPAVLNPCGYLERLGHEVTYLPVNSKGVIDLDEISKSIRKNTILISIIYANNELGTIQDIANIGSIAKEREIYFHTDAAQAVGHLSVDVEKAGIDLLSISAHKFGGPKGVGALYIRSRSPRVKLAPIIYGGNQERGIRSGTLNVPGIVGLGEACKIARHEMKALARQNKVITGKLWDELIRIRPDISINGDMEHRLPHTINIEIPGVDNKWLSLKLSQYCFSTGSACSEQSDKPSHVLTAIGLDSNRCANCIRIGVGRNTTDKDVEQFVQEISEYISL